MPQFFPDRGAFPPPSVSFGHCQNFRIGKLRRFYDFHAHSYAPASAVRCLPANPAYLVATGSAAIRTLLLDMTNGCALDRDYRLPAR